MELTIRQPCPTCGAEISLKEDDRLIQCEYCDEKNYMVHRKHPRYVLPANLPQHIDENMLHYVPYLRFKGTIYYCLGGKLHHKLIDTTRVGSEISSLPVSLGLRPQAMSISRITSNLRGTYIHQSIPARRIFEDAAKLTTLFRRDTKEKPRHRAFIGETVSRVYLPVYSHSGILYDGVTNLELGPGSVLEKLQDKTVSFKPDWEPHFLSTLCPQCGASMHGTRDSLVMTCTNCDTLWEEVGSRFAKINFTVIPSQKSNTEYLPFWLLEPVVEGAELKSLADYIRLANLPMVPQKIHRDKRLAIVVPAFKVKPRAAMVVSKKLTVLQTVFHEAAGGPAQRSYPVTMPFTEAVQALKSVLVGTAVSQKKVIDQLDRMTITTQGKTLLYLPFIKGRDYIQEQTGVSISAVALTHGRRL